MFAAAASSDEDLRNSLISLVHSYAFTPRSNAPISLLYDPTTGNSVGGSNSLIFYILPDHHIYNVIFLQPSDRRLICATGIEVSLSICRAVMIINNSIFVVSHYC